MRIAVSGHRGLSDEVSALVRDAMRAELSQYADDGNLVGLSCLADGADQIFALLVLEAGGVLEAVVPASQYREGLPADAQPCYDELLAQAATVHRTSHVESTSQAHMEASQLMVRKAERLFAVWDGKPARAFGGTADVVAFANEHATPVTVVWPPGAERS